MKCRTKRQGKKPLTMLTPANFIDRRAIMQEAWTIVRRFLGNGEGLRAPRSINLATVTRIAIDGKEHRYPA